MAKTHVTEQLTKIEIEDLYQHIRRALGVSLALSGKAGGDENDTYAAETIAESLYKARKMLETDEADHG